MQIPRDLRLAFWTLFGRDRVTTMVCLVTLALGIGANTAIFTVIQSVLLKPLLYDHPERIFRFHATFESRPDSPSQVINGLNFVDYRDQVPKTGSAQLGAARVGDNRSRLGHLSNPLHEQFGPPKGSRDNGSPPS